MATFWDELKLKDSVSNSLKKIQENSNKLTEKTEKLQGKMSTLQSKLVNFGNKVSVVAPKVAKFGSSVAKSMAKISAAYTAVAGVVSLVSTKILSSANKYADFGDRIDKVSQKIGMSKKGFQEWDYIMSQNGGNVESLQMGFKTLVTQMEGVKKGSKDSVNAFSALGVSVKNSNGQFRQSDDVFNDVIKKLQQVKDPTQKMILANRLFGRSAAELRPLLNQEASAIEELREKANSLGLIIPEEEIKNAVKFKDTMDTFSRVFEAKFATIMMKLMPSFTDTLEEIMFLLNQNPEFLDAIENSLKWIVTILLPDIIETTIDIFNFFKGIRDFLKQITDFFGAIPGFIADVVGGFLAMVGNMFTALKNGLTSAANAIKSVFDGVLQGIWNWIQKIVNAIANAIKGLGNIASNLPGIGKLIGNIGGGGGGKTVNNTTYNNSSTTKNYFTTPKASSPAPYGSFKSNYVPAH
jgi:CII-binding regulator of phage lambda lysogenization HflD